MSGAPRFARHWKTRSHIATLLTLALSGGPAWSAEEPAMPENAADTTMESTQAAAPAAENTSGRVARAIFTTAITDREPVDDIQTLANNVDRVFFFSDLRGLDGQIVTHRWEHAGEVKAEVTFKVGNGARWRVYSSKNLLPEWTGTWTVVVSTQDGQVLQTSNLEYTANSQ